MLKIYTDGACVNNGSPKAKAAYGFVVIENDQVIHKEGERCEGAQTNNVGELTAILKAMFYCLEGGYESATIYSDSKYAINSITEWNIEKKIKGQKKKNYDLIKECKYLFERQEIEFDFVWIKGHSDDYFNDMADSLATGAI